MKIYSENKNYKLYQGTMLDMLEVIEKESIDSIVTDPPYELNFMGKGWDNAGISFNPNTWKQCYEVLKPGGYLLYSKNGEDFCEIGTIESAEPIIWNKEYEKYCKYQEEIYKGSTGEISIDIGRFGKKQWKKIQKALGIYEYTFRKVRKGKRIVRIII